MLAELPASETDMSAWDLGMFWALPFWDFMCGVSGVVYSLVSEFPKLNPKPKNP